MHIVTANRGVLLMSLEGEVIGRWGEKRSEPGQIVGYPHGLWFDRRGDLYVAEVGAENRLRKYARV